MKKTPWLSGSPQPATMQRGPGYPPTLWPVDQPSRLAICIIAPISPQGAGPNYGVRRLSEVLHTHGSDTAIGLGRSYRSQCDDKSGNVNASPLSELRCCWRWVVSRKSQSLPQRRPTLGNTSRLPCIVRV
jgi:hypothetical protein